MPAKTTDFEAAIAKLRDRFGQLGNQIEVLVMDTLIGRESEIEDLNIAQLQKGKDSTGQEIAPPYTAFTKRIKRAKGQPTDRVTLKDEGDFYRGIEYKVNPKGIEYKGNDPKTQDLKEKYGEEILGLDEASKAEVAEMILEELPQTVKIFITK